MEEGDAPPPSPEALGLPAMVLGAAAICTVLVTNVGVFARYVARVSLPSVEEILGFLFVWLIFVCSALSFREGGLIGITMLGDALQKRPRLFRVLVVIQNLAVLAFSLVMVHTGYRMLDTQFEFEELSVVLEVNRGWMTIGCVVGFLAMAGFALVNIYRALFPRRPTTPPAA
ncbi:MAG: TRAP transporter small permease subunit [Planctomycetes bacterium]|nr:TRAP transporter small permease subunit [Planctomycetota bacterium]